MTLLLDINVIIARLDRGHQFHERVTNWMTGLPALKIASCAITELGVLRIYGHPSYPGGPGTPGNAAQDLTVVRAMQGHLFLSQLHSPLDAHSHPNLSDTSPKQLTDLYLLALAVRHRIRFATLDGNIPAHLIPGGSDACLIIP